MIVHSVQASAETATKLHDAGRGGAVSALYSSREQRTGRGQRRGRGSCGRPNEAAGQVLETMHRPSSPQSKQASRQAGGRAGSRAAARRTMTGPPPARASAPRCGSFWPATSSASRRLPDLRLSRLRSGGNSPNTIFSGARSKRSTPLPSSMCLRVIAIAGMLRGVVGPWLAEELPRRPQEGWGPAALGCRG